MPLTEIALTPALWALLAGLGGLLAVDGVSMPQVMISRPIVSATIGGALLGDAAGGMLVGALLELLTMRHPPYGAAKYPDTGPAGLIAGCAYAASGTPSIAILVAAVLVGWMTGWMGAYTGYARRLVNGRLIGRPEWLAADPRRLERRHRSAIAIDALRGVVLTGGLLVPSVLIVSVVGVMPVGEVGTAFGSAAVVTALAASIGSGARTTAPDARAWAMVLLGALLVLAALWGRP